MAKSGTLKKNTNAKTVWSPILVTVQETPKVSTGELENFRTFRQSVHNILKNENFHPQKPSI